MLYPGMLGEPLPEWSALVGAEVVSDQVDKTSGDGPRAWRSGEPRRRRDGLYQSNYTVYVDGVPKLKSV